MLLTYITIYPSIMENPEPKLPLYTCPPRCYTCGKVISQNSLLYRQEIKKLTGDDLTTLPIRTINSQKLMSNNSKTAEGEILDKFGITRYCCRGLILSEPRNNIPIIES